MIHKNPMSNTLKKYQYYKVAKPDGWDFYTGKTINYRENIGKTVNNPNKSKKYQLCSDTVLHASKQFFDTLEYSELPCSVYIVEGKPVVSESNKAGFKKLKIVKEIDTTHWQSAYYSIIPYILQDVKNNFDTEKEKDVTKAINQTIKVFKNAQKTGCIDISAAESAARSAEFAARSAEFAAWFAESAAWSAWSAARSAESAARSTWSAARSAEFAARSTAWFAESAAWSTEPKKYKEYSEKFIEFLEEKT